MYAGNVGIVRSLGFIVAPFVLAGLSACGHTSDPAVPCDRIQLGEAHAGTVAAAVDSPVLAISDNPRPYVVHPTCDGGGCRLMRSFLQDDAAAEGEPEPLTGGSAVLLTSTGRYVVAIDSADI